MALTVGTRLGSYEISGVLGAGGMGDVYRARDTALDRLVAIKILTEKLASDPVPLGRFEREARLASSLNHPNIVTIHAVGEAGADRYIAMELVEGETLASMIAAARAAGRALPLRRAVDIAAQIAAGLAAAHDAGIVHRDLKPQNVMVRPDGLVKILDFGLGMLVPFALDTEATAAISEPLTRTGTLLGTLQYMSPEQASARAVDFRSDQFSFGSILYEMVTGRRAFDRPTPVQTLAAIIEQDSPMDRLAADLPDVLVSVVARCLAKEPRDRFASTQDLARDLAAVRDRLGDSRAYSSATRLLTAPPRFGRIRAVRWTAGLLIAATAALVSTRMLRDRSSRAAPEAAVAQQLAVLPFTNVGGDPANQSFSDGLVEILTSQLTQLGHAHGLEIVPASDVRREKIVSVRDARRAFNVSRAITGSVQRASGRVRVTINLVDATTLRQVDARSLNLELDDAAAMQDGVVRQMAQLVGAAYEPETRRALAEGGTSVSGAYDAYLQARGYLQHYEKLDAVELAVSSFQRAVAQDPDYALAHAGLGEAYWRKYQLTKDPQWAEAARASCAAALRVTTTTAAAHLTLGVIDAGTGRYDDAVTNLKRAIALDPLSGDAYRELANAYQALGRKDEAEKTYRAAIEVRPNYWANYNDLGRFYFMSARYVDAEKQFQRVIDVAPDSERGYSSLGAIYFSTKRYDLAQAMFEKSVAVKPNADAFSNLGTLHYYNARYAEAARMYERALALREHDSLLWINLASALALAPDGRGKARQAYEKAAGLTDAELRVNPKSVTLLLRMADCESQLGKPAHARELVAQALALSANEARVLVRAGLVYEQLGDRARAIEYIRNALAAGYSRDEIDRMPGLASLRADPRFSRPE